MVNQKNDINLQYFVDEKLKNSTDYRSAEKKLKDMLSGYTVIGNPVALPDLTDCNSLPVGTTTIIDSDNPINPAFIGMDIGCGFNFFSLDVNPKRFYKKGKLKENAVSSLVESIDDGIKVAVREKDIYMGTLGKGNHFIDLFVVEDIYDKDYCEEKGLDEKKIYFMIHSGSREFGFDTNAKFSKLFKNVNDINKFNNSYMKSFGKARDYAFKNRESLRNIVLDVMESQRGEKISTKLFYDKPHNDIEVQENGSLNYKLKKGTNSLKEDELFVIPGNCTSNAYVIKGGKGLKESHGTINHGCGRKYTRSQIFSRYGRSSKLDSIFKEIVLNVSPKQMIEEIPKAYKKIEDIISSVEKYNLGEKVAKLKPLGVIVERKQERRK